MTGLLGGSLQPIGTTVQIVDAPLEVTLDEHIAWRQSLEHERIKVSKPLSFRRALKKFLPFQSPWTRELLFAVGNKTAYLNNSIGGGDPSASISVAARHLGVAHIVAMNSLRSSAGHQSTQLWYTAPDGTHRSIAAACEDGRWLWLETGSPLPFEDTDRYTRRLKRERFDRAMLMDYLAALGIHLPDDRDIESATVVQQIVEWRSRTVTLDQSRSQA